MRGSTKVFWKKLGFFLSHWWQLFRNFSAQCQIPIQFTDISFQRLVDESTQFFRWGCKTKNQKKTLATHRDFVNCIFSLKFFYWSQIIRSFLFHCQKFSPIRALGIFSVSVSAENECFVVFSPQLRASCFWPHTEKSYFFPKNCNQRLFF